MRGGYDGALAWISDPINAVLVLIAVSAALYHMRLGMKEIIEDYIGRKSTKFVLLILNTFLTVALFVAAAYAVLKIAVGQPARRGRHDPGQRDRLPGAGRRAGGRARALAGARARVTADTRLVTPTLATCLGITAGAHIAVYLLNATLPLHVAATASRHTPSQPGAPILASDVPLSREPAARSARRWHAPRRSGWPRPLSPRRARTR